MTRERRSNVEERRHGIVDEIMLREQLAELFDAGFFPVTELEADVLGEVALRECRIAWLLAYNFREMREAVALQRAEFVGNLRSVRQPGPEQPRRIDKWQTRATPPFFAEVEDFVIATGLLAKLDRLISDEERGVRSSGNADSSTNCGRRPRYSRAGLSADGRR